jgi:hypothetical protein
MRNQRRGLALVAAGLGLVLAGTTGCQTWVGGMTLPSPHYLEHYPQYFPPDPAFPLPRELASQEDPAGAAARAGVPGLGVAPVAPVAPVPLQPGMGVGGPFPPGGGGPAAPGAPPGVVPPR